jgi:hypothetical protein
MGGGSVHAGISHAGAIDRSTETLALVDMIRAELMRQAQDDEDDIELLLMVA